MYPVQYEADYVEQRSRLTTFFRFLTVIPASLLTILYVFAAEVVVFVAWFAIVFTGRYPEGMYKFVAGAVRNASRLTGYQYLLTDKYPPWNGDEEPQYPIRVRIGPPLEQYSRAKAFFRIILAIPVMIIAYVYNLVIALGALCAWFAIVFTGKQPEGLQNFINMGMRYHVQSMTYYFLLTQDWPPLSEEPRQAIPPAPGGTLPGERVEAPAYQPPVTPES